MDAHVVVVTNICAVKEQIIFQSNFRIMLPNEIITTFVVTVDGLPFAGFDRAPSKARGVDGDFHSKVSSAFRKTAHSRPHSRLSEVERKMPMIFLAR